MRHLPINYPGLEEYLITEDGEVIGKDGVSKLSQFKTQRGYLQVGLYIAGNNKRKFSVARLVALTYVPTADTTLDVDHIDGNKLNNHYTNLQWLTRSENVAKAFRQGRVGSRKGKISGKLTGLYLSHEAIAILDTVDNKSKFVDKLIKESQPENTPSPKNTETKTWRDMGDVLADIRLAEARKEEELRYCQDTEYGKQITDRYEAELKPLWAEYNELRGTEA